MNHVYTLERTIYNELVDLWQFGERTIESSYLLHRLSEGGVSITDQAMRSVFQRLLDRNLIQIGRSTNMAKDVIITWVDTSEM